MCGQWHLQRRLADAPGGVLDASAVNAVAAALPGDSTVHESENSSYKDGLYIEQWVTEQFGFVEPIVPEHWG